MKNIYEQLQHFGKTDYNVPLSSMTTLRIGGNARYVCYPDDVVSLDGIIRLLDKEGIPYKVFGRGSNMLCSDDDYEGAIIRLDRGFDRYYFNDDHLIAYAGCSIIHLAYESMKNELSGLEFASGIPGTVGGLTFMNAGAYKSCMKDIVERVMVYRNGTTEWINADDCGFAYRHSIFHEHPDWIILAADMKLEHKDDNEIREVIESRKARRMATQPLDKPSAGSVFRNPDEIPAWQLIEGIGYRGRQVGGAKVSEKHVNFIVNENRASATDFMTLVDEITKKVMEQYGIELHMEVEKFNWR